MSKKPLFIIVVFLVVCFGIFLAFKLLKKQEIPKTAPVQNTSPKYEILGQSVEGRKIESYTYGEGSHKLVFVGGVHGGYEWNSVLLSYQMLDYLNENPEVIPTNMKVSVIPNLNPDGVFKVTGKVGRFDKTDVSTSTKILASGRFNANEVDLNRNFDCKWKPESTWQSKTVSAGKTAFSEPESQALKNFILKNNLNGEIQAVIFWHSKANAVYASECTEGILPETLDIMNTYSKASGYKPIKSFDSYEITGDAEGWLASVNIPAITVELKTHETTEWSQNLSGIKALFTYYANKK